MVVACATIVNAGDMPVQLWFREAMANTAFPYASIRHAPKPDPETPSLVITRNAVLMYALTDGLGPIVVHRKFDECILHVFAAICTMNWSARHLDQVNDFWRHFVYEILSHNSKNLHVATDKIACRVSTVSEQFLYE